MVALWILCLGQVLFAQDFESYRNSVKAGFENYRQEKRTAFEQYRDSLNREFAAALAGHWTERDAASRRERPSIPGPFKPIASDGTMPDEAVGVAAGEVKGESLASPPPPVTPPRGKGRKNVTGFIFYNTRCGLGAAPLADLGPTRLDNKAVARLWERFTESESGLVDDCLALRDDLNLCDWGYLQLTGEVSRVMIPDNEVAAGVMWAWLMCQSGYDVRPAIADGTLILLFNTDRVVYERPGYNIDGRTYYPVNPPEGGYGSLRAVDRLFSPQSVPLRMTVDRVPRFADAPLPDIYKSSSWKGAPPFRVPVGAQLASFLRGFPLVDWTSYAEAELSPWVTTTVVEALRIITDGMEAHDAVNTILDYTQHGFDYMTDGDQFGAEKPFFFEENFVYPFNDCEDRAILFARLVHDLLGLDVVFLHYPKHLCTAVDIPGQDSGYHVTVDGRRFWICDPCYIPSRAGALATPYRKSTPEIIRVPFE